MRPGQAKPVFFLRKITCVFITKRHYWNIQSIKWCLFRAGHFTHCGGWWSRFHNFTGATFKLQKKPNRFTNMFTTLRWNQSFEFLWRNLYFSVLSDEAKPRLYRDFISFDYGFDRGRRIFSGTKSDRLCWEWSWFPELRFRNQLEVHTSGKVRGPCFWEVDTTWITRRAATYRKRSTNFPRRL